MIGVIDYNTGNVGSILNMLRRLGHPASLIFDHEQILAASGLILPGVGSFDQGVLNLRERGLIECLNEAVLIRNIPIFGVCLGMQLLAEGSDEGRLPGLGWIPGHSRRFSFPGSNSRLRVPHMCWSEVCALPQPDSTRTLAAQLFSGTLNCQRYYFVHSYHVCCTDPADVLAEAQYGYRFSAAIGRGHIVGTQFHPEKSHRHGMTLMNNYAMAVLKRETIASGS